MGWCPQTHWAHGATTPPGAWAGTEAQNPGLRPPLPPQPSIQQTTASALRDRKHSILKTSSGGAGRGRAGHHVSAPSGLSNHQGPPSNQRAPLQLLERQSRPPLGAPRLLLPAWQSQGTRVLSLPPRGTNHTTGKKTHHHQGLRGQA